jgi:hypothetical protein
VYHQWFYPDRWDPPNKFAYTYIKYYYVDSEAASSTVSRQSPILPGLFLLLFAGTPVVLMGIKVYRNQR